MALQTPVAWELQPVQLTDRDTFKTFLAGQAQPLSDYTFAQVYGWRNALDLWWRVIDGHLCVFANGSNLSLLMPPMAPPGTPGMERALRRACEVMHDYNAELAAREKLSVVVAPRIESVSDELLARVPDVGYAREALGADYVYNVGDMIELAGGAFKSKRHDKNYFTRAWRHRAEAFDPARDAGPCAELLSLWHHQSDAGHAGEDALNTQKRLKEALAASAQTIEARDLGLTGLCVWVDGPGEHAEPRPDDEPASAGGALQVPKHPDLVAFTLGEPLGADMSSILVEKADREYRGLAQFIFSEFCRVAWADRPFVNAGDDWGLETLARTKQSYRPVRMLTKYALTRLRPVSIFLPGQRPAAQREWAGRLQSACDQEYEPLAVVTETSLLPLGEPVSSDAVPPEPSDDRADQRITFRAAELSDLPAAMALEQQCFTDAYPLSPRQLRHHQRSRSSIFVVASRETAHGDVEVVGEGIALIRRHRGRDGAERQSGRVYTIAVAPTERGKGTGRRLLETLLSELTARGVNRAFLEVAEDNAPAIGLYLAYGFSDIGTLPDYYAPGRHAKHMMKPLDPAVPVRSGAQKA